MRSKTPSLTLGVEEEYFLVDKATRDLLSNPSPDMFSACENRFPGQVSHEFIRCQLEVGTKVCKDVSEVRKELVKLRSGIATEVESYGVAPIAASTHPFARWQDQQHTQKERYLQLAENLQAVAQRMLIGGMHIHFGIEDKDLRIDLMNQFIYFLPHLLAMSCSSPFWHGYKTGLQCYRLTVFNDLPRTGLPSRFESYAEYRRHVDILIKAGIIEDATKLWWDVRPSDRYPTLEVRIMDLCTDLNHAVSITALAQALFLTLYRLKEKNLRWRIYRKMLVSENRWRAMRYGMDESMIDFGKDALVNYQDLMAELFEEVKVSAKELGCYQELLGCKDILDNGNSAKQQIAIYDDAILAGKTENGALFAVVDWLVEKTVAF